jgi:hypothetical protein
VSTVVVRVTVADVDAAGGLIQELVREVDAERVSLDSATKQVGVEVDKHPDPLVGILNVVEAWLASGEHAPSTISVDERSYVLAPPRVAGAVRRAAHPERPLASRSDFQDLLLEPSV